MARTRNHNGYLQVLNAFEEPAPAGGFRVRRQWQYVVHGFTFDGKGATMALYGGGESIAPIDGQDRITLRTGPRQYRKVSRKFWHH